jgi:hypothetical protein
MCFDEVRRTKAINNNPWSPVCYILHPHEGISSHMLGNVVLGGTLPTQVKGVFLDDGTANIMRCF